MNHIKRDETTTWCDTTLTDDFHFKDIEQAVMNGLHGDRMPCGRCIDVLIKCLELRGKQYNEAP